VKVMVKDRDGIDPELRKIRRRIRGRKFLRNVISQRKNERERKNKGSSYQKKLVFEKSTVYFQTCIALGLWSLDL
jgi:hypothetical protein